MVANETDYNREVTFGIHTDINPDIHLNSPAATCEYYDHDQLCL